MMVRNVAMHRCLFPSPLWGGVRGGGVCINAIGIEPPPSLSLPRKGGGNASLERPSGILIR